jgi:hypothetical protein
LGFGSILKGCAVCWQKFAGICEEIVVPGDENLHNFGWNEECSRGLTPRMHTTSRFDSQNGDFEDFWPMKCRTRSVVNIYQHFRGTCYLLHQGVKVDGSGSFETSVNVYQTTQHHM